VRIYTLVGIYIMGVISGLLIALVISIHTPA